MIFVIPGEFTDLNTYVNAERSNRYGAAKIKADETERVAWEVKGRKPIKGRNFYRFTWYCKDKRKDPDGIVGMATKFILDGFIQAGLLENDGWKQIAGFNHSFKVDKENPRVEVVVLRVWK